MPTHVAYVEGFYFLGKSSKRDHMFLSRLNLGNMENWARLLVVSPRFQIITTPSSQPKITDFRLILCGQCTWLDDSKLIS